MVTAITWGAPPKFARLPIRCLRAAVGDVSVKVPSPPPARHHLCVIQDWSVPSTQSEPDFCAAGGLMPRGEQAECLKTVAMTFVRTVAMTLERRAAD